MKKSALHVYALAVCALLIIPLLISGGTAVYGVLQAAWPRLTMPAYEYQRYQSDDAYREHLFERSRFPEDGGGRRVGESPPDAEISERRREAFREAQERERRDGMQSVIRSVIFGLISLALFFPHWRIARRERKAA